MFDRIMNPTEIGLPAQNSIPSTSVNDDQSYGALPQTGGRQLRRFRNE